MPAAMIPRQSLIGGDGAVLQLAYETMNADLPLVGFILIPVVAV